jgi:hypothetical protein
MTILRARQPPPELFGPRELVDRERFERRTLRACGCLRIGAPVCCNMLRVVSTCCTALQRAALRCNVLHWVAACCAVQQHTKYYGARLQALHRGNVQLHRKAAAR